jgi:hypothetical protein
VSCTELSARWNDHQVFFGTVRESGTDTALTTFCSLGSVEHGTVIVFSASAGTMVEEEVLVEGRTEKYFGGIPPDRADSFWCSDGPELYIRPSRPWICLRAADDDPPAAILAVEARGEIGPTGASSGYALELEVRRPGVLHLTYDEQCLQERFDISAGGGADAGALIPWAELTIQ